MQKDVRRYELGYHLVPTLTPETAAESAANLKTLVEKAGGNYLRGAEPKVTELSYPIAKVLESKRSWFDSAYFGWLEFELPSEEAATTLPVLEKSLDGMKEVLRHIMLATEEEAPVAKRLTPEERAQKNADDAAAEVAMETALDNVAA